jgi:hypothetical protein
MARENFREEDVCKLLVECHRRCCVCHVFCGVKMEIDHLVPRSEGGSSAIENAIPLCFDCHAEVHHYNVKHPRGRRFTPEELRGHRDAWLKVCREKPGELTRVKRDVKVGPLQAMVDELDYNAMVADLYTQPKTPLGVTLARRQFHRAVASGAVAMLDRELKEKIYAAYAAADTANQQLARDQASLARDPTLSLYRQQTHTFMGETVPIMRAARDLLLTFASPQE